MEVPVRLEPRSVVCPGHYLATEERPARECLCSTPRRQSRKPRRDGNKERNTGAKATYSSRLAPGKATERLGIDELQITISRCKIMFDPTLETHQLVHPHNKLCYPTSFVLFSFGSGGQTTMGDPCSFVGTECRTRKKDCEGVRRSPIVANPPSMPCSSKLKTKTSARGPRSSKRAPRFLPT